MNKWLEIIMGLILLVFVVYVWGMNYLGVGTAAIELFKGGLVWLVILIGAIFIMLGISEIKE
jgi:hypothetical protein